MEHMTEFSNGLHKGSRFVVSDELFCDQVGASAWIIEGKDHTNRLIGTINTPGGNTDHSAFHSEVAGILGIMLTLTNSISNSWNDRSIPIQVVFNGRLVLWIQLEQLALLNEPHADLLLAIKNLMI